MQEALKPVVLKKTEYSKSVEKKGRLKKRVDILSL